MRGVEINIARDEQIQVAVAIVIHEGATGVPADIRVGQAGFFGDIGESAIAIIVQEHVVSPEGDEEISETVVVVIAGADALAPSGAARRRLFG